ncbi:MAG: deoxyribonuclease V [Salinisphaera sp.]|nr:deoxyribonuclease V [Salinisphaera sp.]
MQQAPSQGWPRVGRITTHDWGLNPRQAAALQRRLAGQAVHVDQLPAVHSIAGVDVAFEAGGDITRAAAVLFDAQTLLPVAAALARMPTRLPYVPGLLSFREAPAIVEALAALPPVDLLLCDGHGYAHPRRLGVACHLGLVSGLATIGVAKSRLVGEYAAPASGRGAWTSLRHEEEVIGAVLRSRTGVKPIFVSSGHRTSLETAVDWALRCHRGRRLPEPVRLADKLAAGSFQMQGHDRILLPGYAQPLKVYYREDGKNVEPMDLYKLGGAGARSAGPRHWPGSDRERAGHKRKAPATGRGAQGVSTGRG